MNQSPEIAFKFHLTISDENFFKVNRMKHWLVWLVRPGTGGTEPDPFSVLLLVIKFQVIFFFNNQ